MAEHADVVIVGAGHNGLVAATYLARAGLRTVVLERDTVVGGAARTEHPFPKAPGLGASTGAYLLGLMPPEILADLGLDLPLMRRDPHYFLPLLDGRSLVLGADDEENRTAIASVFGAGDADAVARYQQDLAGLREDLAPAWLAPPLPLEETAERYVRTGLREVFIRLVRGSAAEHLTSYGFESELLMAMYAVTDAFPGTHGTWTTPGTGHNLLVHNCARLPGSDGTWMVVRGGMGTVTRMLADAALREGAVIHTGSEVSAILTNASGVEGVVTTDAREITTSVVLVNADPWRLAGLVGVERLGPIADRLEVWGERPGTTLKLNLALSALPRFPAAPDRPDVRGATIHLLPDQRDPLAGLERGFGSARDGELADEPTIEMYVHTAVDPSLQDDQGRHSAALFVQWVPNRPAGGWGPIADPYADQLLSIVDRFAPGTSQLVVDRQVLHPEAIEQHFGITGGNIFHVDNRFAFDERLPYRLPVDGLYACGAGCHPAGSVIGAAGRNAALAVLEDLR